MTKQKSFSDLLKSFKADTPLTKSAPKEKVFTKIKNNIPMHANWNQMADILYLPVETKKGYKYGLVVVDLATNKFDIEPLKTKDAVAVLNALQTMYTRNYVKVPYASLQTDSGKEFAGVFHKWLYNENVDHKVTLPNRHSQMSSVESLNKQLGTLIMGYLNSLEEESGKTETDWVSLLPKIRKELNEYREIDLKKVKYPNDQVYFDPPPKVEPKFKVGDIVYQKLDWPEDALGHKQPTPNFRAGDYRFSRVPKKIVEVFNMPDQPWFRYQLEGMKNVSYTEAQLRLSDEKEKETKYVVKAIIDTRMKNKKREFLVHWKGSKKGEATYEPETTLREDGVGPIIDEFLKNKNKKQTKK
jgi:hypothetical protein